MINPQVSQVPVVLAYKKDIEIDVWPHKVDMVHLFFSEKTCADCEKQFSSSFVVPLWCHWQAVQSCLAILF